MKSMSGLIYKASRWDAYCWDEVRIAYPEADAMIAEGCDRINAQFPALALELFQRLYGTPELLDPIRPECQWAKALHSSLEQLPEWGAMAAASYADRGMAGIATLAFTQRLLREWPTEDAPEAPDLNEPEALRQAFHAAKNGTENEQAASPANSPANAAQDLAQIRQQGQAAVQKVVAYAEAVAAALDGSMGQAVRAAVTDAAQELKQVKAAIATLSFGNSLGTLSAGGDIATKVAIAQGLSQNPSLKRIVDLAGRMEIRARKRRRSRSKRATTDLVGVTQGRDLARLLPTETAKLAMPALQPQFVQGYMESSLNQYQLGGKERQGKGPLVIALDSSGSMQGAEECWSKAVALTLLKTAIKQKRAVRLLHFDGEVRRVDDFSAAKQRHSQATILESMVAFFGGGTNWQAALDCAADAIKSANTSTKAFHNADIVLITDGVCRMAPEWLTEWQKQSQSLGITTYGVLLGRARGGTVEMERFCDRILHIADLDLSDDSKADPLFDIA